MVVEIKTKIMEALLTAATQYGKTECALDPELLKLSSIRNWLTGQPLQFVIKNNNTVDWSRGGQQ